MGQQVCMGAMLKCSMGLAPSSLIVLPANRVMTQNGALPVANIQDSKPIANIPPFGMCNSTSNPMVIAATAAALGVHTPMPCMPALTAPWAPGSPTVLVGGQPALNNSSKLMCMWAGVIEITQAGQTTVQVP